MAKCQFWVYLTSKKNTIVENWILFANFLFASLGNWTSVNLAIFLFQGLFYFVFKCFWSDSILISMILFFILTVEIHKIYKQVKL